MRPVEDFPAQEEIYRTHYRLCEPDENDTGEGEGDE